MVVVTRTRCTRSAGRARRIAGPARADDTQPMDQRFPECKQLHEAYRKCFAQQPFRWGQATGTTEDKCEDAYEAFRECVETSLEKQKDKK